jgi:hypothetical protein
MLFFVALIATSFCKPLLPSTSNIFNSSACSDTGHSNSTSSITCRSIRQSCDSPQELKANNVCNLGLICAILKKDHSYRCATITEIQKGEEFYEPELIVSRYHHVVKMAVCLISIILILFLLILLYAYYWESLPSGPMQSCLAPHW